MTISKDISVYKKLGVTPIINGRGCITIHGGKVMSEAVVASMLEASKSSVLLNELIDKATARLADLTGAEGAFISPLEPAKGGFIGLNFHYLKPGARVAFLRSLANTTSNKKYDKTTRYRINWRNNLYMRKTAKHYLFSQVRSSFLNITADEMAIAIFLPVARFKKGSPY